MKKIIILSVMMLFIASLSVSSDYKEITVGNGQSIESIAKANLKNKDNWQALLTYNNLKSPKDVKPGMKLKIPYSLSAERIAKITFVKGSVTVNDSAATLGSLVKKGDRVKTGADGAATIKLDDGSNVKVENSSEVVLSDYGFQNKGRTSNVQLAQGGMLVKVNKLTQKSNFNVSSVSAVAGVRGTTFRVTKDNLSVYAGKVEISDSKNNVVSIEQGGAAQFVAKSKDANAKNVKEEEITVVKSSSEIPRKLDWIK